MMCMLLSKKQFQRLSAVFVIAVSVVSAGHAMGPRVARTLQGVCRSRAAVVPARAFFTQPIPQNYGSSMTRSGLFQSEIQRPSVSTGLFGRQFRANESGGRSRDKSGMNWKYLLGGAALAGAAGAKVAKTEKNDALSPDEEIVLKNNAILNRLIRGEEETAGIDPLLEKLRTSGELTKKEWYELTSVRVNALLGLSVYDPTLLAPPGYDEQANKIAKSIVDSRLRRVFDALSNERGGNANLMNRSVYSFVDDHAYSILDWMEKFSDKKELKSFLSSGNTRNITGATRAMLKFADILYPKTRGLSPAYSDNLVKVLEAYAEKIRDH